MNCAPRFAGLLLLSGAVLLLASCRSSAAASETAAGNDAASATSTPRQVPPFCDRPQLDGRFARVLSGLTQQRMALGCERTALLAWGDPRQVEPSRRAVAANYQELSAEFDALRRQLRQLPRQQALDETRQLLPQALARVALPPWLGTRWGFDGASDRPGEGDIACGYFVVAALHAVGFRVANRPVAGGRRLYPLATRASEPVIRALVAPHSIRRFSDQPVSEVLAWVRSQGAGAYLVGLDQHFALLLYDGQGPVWLWHAKPHHEVRLEPPAEAPYFSQSRYRVVAPLDQRSAALWLDHVMVTVPH